MASYRKRGRVWYFRYTDADGVKREKKGCTDKRATEAMAAAVEAEVGRIRVGLSDRGSEDRRRHAAAPLSAHLHDWYKHLVAKGDTEKHAEASLNWASVIVALVGGTPLGDIDIPRRATRAARERFKARLSAAVQSVRVSALTRDGVQSALATLRHGGRSHRTCNAYRTAIRGFTRWAKVDGRIADDPLAGVASFNEKEDRRHDRRTRSKSVV